MTQQLAARTLRGLNLDSADATPTKVGDRSAACWVA